MVFGKNAKAGWIFARTIRTKHRETSITKLAKITFKLHRIGLSAHSKAFSYDKKTKQPISSQIQWKSGLILAWGTHFSLRADNGNGLTSSKRYKMVNISNLSVSHALSQMIQALVFFYSQKQKSNTKLAKYGQSSIPPLGQMPYKTRSNNTSTDSKIHVNQLNIQL